MTTDDILSELLRARRETPHKQYEEHPITIAVNEHDALCARVARLEAALDAAYAWWITVPKTINVMQPPWVERARAALDNALEENHT